MRMRAQVIFQGGTALPQDRFVNTWHFADLSEPDLPTKAAVAHTALTDFYNNATTGAALSSYMSHFVQTAVQVRYYDLSQPEPRVPYTLTFNRVASVAGVDLPEEVAVVLSLAGTPPITPRRRGRLYMGPLNVAASDGATTTTPSAVSPAYRTKLAQRAAAMSINGTAWSIYSPTTDQMVLVDSGFIDNAFDTQRRRGPKATTRTTWT